MIKKLITLLVIVIWFLFLPYSYSTDNSDWILDNIFQESINNNFKPIDDRIERYLTNLNDSKNYCFWKDKQMNFTECVDYIEKIFSINSDEFVLWEDGYSEACKKSLAETIEQTEDKTIASKDTKTILNKNWNWRTCRDLYLFKLNIYKSVAYDILKMNKYSILKDEHKKYSKENRKRYDDLLDLIRVNIGYIERLWKKWPSKTKK